MPDTDDVVRCWRCGFDLSGLHESAVCPECGLRLSIARQQEAPLVIGSRAQKWSGIFALVSFTPLVLLGFVFNVVADLVSGGTRTSMYLESAVFAFASIAGITAAWFMKVPKIGSGALSYISMALCATLLLYWPVRISVEGSTLGYPWRKIVPDIFLITLVCAIGTLLLQASVLARRMGIARPVRHTVSFREISHLAFVSAGLLGIGILILSLAPGYTLRSGHNPGGLVSGLGVLLGIAALILWTINIVPVIYQLARWPVGEHRTSTHT